MTSSTFRMNVNKTQADLSYTENIVCTLNSSCSNEYPEGPLTVQSYTSVSLFIYSCSYCVCLDLKCLRCHNSEFFIQNGPNFQGVLIIIQNVNIVSYIIYWFLYNLFRSSINIATIIQFQLGNTIKQ